MRISDWSSDVCSSDLYRNRDGRTKNLSPGNPDLDDTNQLSFRASLLLQPTANRTNTLIFDYFRAREKPAAEVPFRYNAGVLTGILLGGFGLTPADAQVYEADLARSEEHTSELQSLTRISYAVFCLLTNNGHPA